MKPRFDETDREIIGLLARDGRMTAKSLSKRLGLAEATVRNRMNRIMRSGLVKVAGLMNHDAFENRVGAIVALEITEACDLDRIGQEIAALPSVQNVSIVSGRHDIMVEVLVSSHGGIIRFLTDELAGIKGIGKSETFMVLKSYNKWVIPE
jgi:Lrp/AsnC family transcriptional regulator for asnA, asnC and gidA